MMLGGWVLRSRTARIVLFVLVASAAGSEPAAAACPPRAVGTYGDTGPPRPGYPDDPLFAHQQHLHTIRVPAVWSRGFLGKHSMIAVADSGIDVDHPEFRGRLLPGADTFEQLPGKLDCPPGPVVEADGHGTGVAGVAAAAADNGVGLAGVAPRALILPVRVFDDVEGGESPLAMAAGIRYAAEHGADVINASFSTGVTGLDRPELLANQQGVKVLDRDVAALADAVAYAWQRGAVVVASAGNTAPGVPQATDVPICDAPAYFPNVVCVVATETDGTPSPFSHLAVREDGGVAVAAPGFRRSPLTTCESIVSTWPGTMPYANPNPVFAPDSCPLPRGYTWRSFTSNAAPQVSGLVALMATAGMTPEEILDRLRTSSSNRGDWDPWTGYGVIDAKTALAGERPGRRSCRRRPVHEVRFSLREGERIARVVRATVDRRRIGARRVGAARIRLSLPRLRAGQHVLRVRARTTAARVLKLVRRFRTC